MSKTDKNLLAINKNAYRAFIIEDTLEAGLVLQGTEVKSIKEGKASLKESYAIVKKDEIYLKNMHIKPYDFGNINNHNPLRTRKLLLHKKEIFKLSTKINQRGYTLIVTKLYLSKGKIKAELALAKGKSHKDRRDDIKKREAKRDIERAMKNTARSK